jgi:BASS family bile acid:Na+ symporter
MTVEQLINVLVAIALVEMMVAIGLGVNLIELSGVARNWRLVGRAVLANYVLVPAVTVGLLLLVDASPMVAAGFLILAVCPGAPLAPPLTALARGNVPVSVGLMVILAGSSAVVAPLLLYFLLPLTSGEQSVRIDESRLVTTLLMTQFVPLGVGLAVRQWRPRLADQFRKPANQLCTGLGVLAIGAILATQFHTLLEIRLRGLLGMLVFLIASLVAGWLLGGPGRDRRKAMTLTTALRNVGVGLVIATGVFGSTAAVTAAVAYGLLELVGTLALALVWARRTPRPAAMKAVLVK